MVKGVVAIPDWLEGPADIEQEVLGPGVRILGPDSQASPSLTDEMMREADAILAWHETRLDRTVLERLERCRVVVRYGVGTDNVDVAAAGELGIAVCNVPDYGVNDVADHAMALLLTLHRRLPAFDEKVRESSENWNWFAVGSLHRLTGRTLAILGLGDIGSAMAVRAKAFGLHVVAYDPYVSDGRIKVLGIERAETLDSLLSRADFVSLHMPLTPETRGIVDDSFLSKLPEGAILINTARGQLVRTSALEEALRTGRLAGAGLDVLETEPPDSTHPLLRAWREGEEWVRHRLLITPHAAFVSVEALRELRTKTATIARDALSGRPVPNVVNRASLKEPRISPAL